MIVNPHLWIYDGRLDASGRQLVVDVEGPNFDGSGMARYQDIIEIVDRNHWILRSRLLRDDGVSHHFWKDILAVSRDDSDRSQRQTSE